MRRYTDFYGAKETPQNDYVAGSYPFNQSFHIADDALSRESTALSDVLGWWKPIATNPAYPKILRTAGLNELYQTTSNGSFWEGGLVSNSETPTGPKRLGTLFPGTHLFFNLDSSDGANASDEIDVDSYAYTAWQSLFPFLERDFLRGVEEQAMQDPSHAPYKNPVDITMDPWVTWKAGDAGQTTSVNSYESNASGDRIIRAYTYARRSGDNEFLKWAYPAMQESLAAIQTYILPGTDLPMDPEYMAFANTYDSVLTNVNDLYSSEKYLLALEMVIDTAKRLGRPAAEIAGYQTTLDQAKQKFELLFWDPVGGYYKITDGVGPNTEGALLDSFFSQEIAQQFGLPDVVNTQHEKLQQESLYHRFVFRRDYAGRLLGGVTVLPLGLPVAPTQDMTIYNKECYTLEVCPTVPVYEPDAVFVGGNYFAGAEYIREGHTLHDPLLVQEGEQMAEAVATQVWQVPENGFAFDDPEWWEANDTSNSTFAAYKRPLAIWETLNAIQPLRIPTPTQ
jgi:uncharacterized protein (DUF608 family)